MIMEIILLFVILLLLLLIVVYYRKSKLHFIKLLKELRDQNSTILSDIIIQNQALDRLKDEFNIRISSQFYLGTKWSIFPDSLYRILITIAQMKPNYIVEMGSGASTLYIGLLLKKIGSGKLITLEDNEKYYVEVEKAINKHEIKYQVDLNYCPLVPLNVGSSFHGHWYDTTDITFPSNIEVLVVDGPYGHAHDIARYPAYPLLDNKLSDNSVIFLDDGNRKKKKRISSMWKEYSKGKLRSELIDTYNGLFRFTF